MRSSPVWKDAVRQSSIDGRAASRVTPYGIGSHDEKRSVNYNSEVKIYRNFVIAVRSVETT